MNLMSTPARAMSAPIGLYAHVRSNHARSLLLFGGFLVAVQVMSMAVLIVPLEVFDQSHAPISGFAGYIGRYLLPLALFGALIFGVRYWWHVSAVRKDTGFRYVDSTDEPRLVRLIDPLIMAAGVRAPFLAVIEDPALNAFAVGVREKHMVVVVTRGLIDGLDDEELEAVLAHELMHIRNGDTRLMAAANAFLGNLSRLRRHSMNDEKIEEPAAVIGLALLPGLLPLLLFIGFLGQLAHRIGYFSRAAIGSAREFIADAEAVRLTQNPAALASALRKVSGRDRIAGLAESHDAMLIAGAVEGPAATHPSMAQRIAALIQTTGPALAYAPIRRDTRTPQQRRQSGFGQALGAPFIEDVRAAQRPSLAGLFRLTRDPQRNIFGLRPQGTKIMSLGAAGFVGLWGGIYMLTGREVDLRYLRLARESVRIQTTCQAHVLGMLVDLTTLPAECSEENLEKKIKEEAARVGLSYATRTEKAQAAFQEEWRFSRENRCFNTSNLSWAHNPDLSRNPSQRSTWDVTWYKEYAADPIPGIETPLAPGQTYADALFDYMSMRVNWAEQARYFLGEDGYKAYLAIYEDPRHQRAVALFREKLNVPAFVVFVESKGSMGQSTRILAEMPDAVPCDLITKGVPFRRLKEGA